jgi:flagellar motor protein MotB
MGRRKNIQNSENSFWLSIGDVMSVLLLLFILIVSIAFVQIGASDYTQKTIFSELRKELNKKKITVEIDEESGSIQIQNEILFMRDDGALKRRGKAFLSQFFPVLRDVISRVDSTGEEIVAIEIIGFTSERKGYYTKFTPKMMTLSLERAHNVWEYIWSSWPDEHTRSFMSKVKVSGYGNMKATSLEDIPRERKVVFQIHFKGILEKMTQFFGKEN